MLGGTPEILINKLAGISSLSEAAALSNFDLVRKGEILKILECPDNQTQLIDLINQEKDTVLALMKVGKRWLWVRDILDKKGLLDKAIMAKNVGMINQSVGNAKKIKTKEPRKDENKE